MEIYRNLSGKSAVSSYEIGSGVITVRFDDGMTYEYTDTSAGKDNIDKMIQLAKIGRGLGTFIVTTVKKRYFRKYR